MTGNLETINKVLQNLALYYDNDSFNESFNSIYFKG